MDDSRLRQLRQRIPQATIDHYAGIPWIQSTLRDPSFHPVSAAREVSHDGAGHTLMGKTWKTATTIPHRLTLRRRGKATSTSTSNNDDPSLPACEDTRAEVRRLYTFGGDLNAHPHLLHGGVIGCVLDSSLGEAVAGTAFSSSPSSEEEKMAIYTVQLNVAYRTPVRTPGTVLVRSWVDRVEGAGGRKIWARGVVEGEGGVVHATGEGLWVKAREGKL